MSSSFVMQENSAIMLEYWVCLVRREASWRVVLTIRYIGMLIMRFSGLSYSYTFSISALWLATVIPFRSRPRLSILLPITPLPWWELIESPQTVCIFTIIIIILLITLLLLVLPVLHEPVCRSQLPLPKHLRQMPKRVNFLSHEFTHSPTGSPRGVPLCQRHGRLLFLSSA